MTSNGSRWTRHSVTLSATALLAVTNSVVAFASRQHVFQHGETLSSIARAYHVSISDLEQANHLDRSESIRDGKCLVIPDPPRQVQVHAAMHRHATAKGDRLSLRLGPGPEYRRVNFVDAGTSLTVTAEQAGWFQVTLDNGRTGWLRRDLVAAGPQRLTRDEPVAAAHHAHKSSQHDINVAGAAAQDKHRKAKHLAAAHIAHHKDLHVAESGAEHRRRGHDSHHPNGHAATVAAHAHHHSEHHTFVVDAAKAHRAAHVATSHRSHGHHMEVAQETSNRADDIVRTAYAYRGTPYVYGGAGRGGFDCSGFTSYLYGRKGVSLPHSARGQFGMGRHVDRSSLKPGDLVFFHTVTPGISHVGMYVGNGHFVHASSRRSGGVRVDSLDSGYYSSAYRGARRMR